MEAEMDLLHSDSKLASVAKIMVRGILSYTENQNTIIPRSRLTQLLKDAKKINNSKDTLQNTLEAVNTILEYVYGMHLVEIPSNIAKLNSTNAATATGMSSNNSTSDPGNANTDHKKGTATHFILLDCLPESLQLENLVELQNSCQYDNAILNGQYITRDMETHNTTSPTLSTEQELTLQGLTCICMCFTAFSNNRVLEEELSKFLQNFGVPTDGTPIPIIDMPIDDLFIWFTKKEYLAKSQEDSETEGTVTAYQMGRRALLEFTPENIAKMAKDLLNQDDVQEQLLIKQLHTVLPQ